MKDYTDAELAEIAEWAETQERMITSAESKKAYGAIRQGMDWLIRYRVMERQRLLENSGTTAGSNLRTIPERKQ
jgi:hypothetical protein